MLPAVINGSIVRPNDTDTGTRVIHGSTLQYECDDGFHPETSTTTCCHNGTWLTTPICKEGPCWLLKPNSITLAGLELVRSRLELKFGLSSSLL